MEKKNFKRVDINSASAQDIADTCVMLGREKADAIVRHREMHGSFKSLAELRAIPGFSWKLSEGLEDFFTLGATGHGENARQQGEGPNVPA